MESLPQQAMLIPAPPTISIIVNDQDLIQSHCANSRDTSNCASLVTTEAISEQSIGSATGMLKCHSMVNIKQQNNSSRRILLTEFQDRIDSATREMSTTGGGYRKSLSRVNLNMNNNIQLKPSGDESNNKLWYLELNDNKKSFLNATASPVFPNRAKLLLLNSPSSSSINKSMSNITKRVTTGYGDRESASGGGLLTPASALDSPTAATTSSRLARLSISRSNLFKSSSSLNALDIEGLDSVSVGSFDRQSLNSCGANSDDLDFLASNSIARRAQLDLTGNSNASTSINKKTSRSFNKKVLNWLNDI